MAICWCESKDCPTCGLRQKLDAALDAMRESFPKSVESCSSCKYLVAGDCRRYPPTRDTGKYAKWPTISLPDYQWCGEYSAKDKIKKEESK